jgi:hypothetical protein
LVQELVSVDRFAGYDPAEWVLEVAFLRQDAPALDVSMLVDSRRTASGQPATSRGWSTLQRVAGRS